MTQEMEINRAEKTQLMAQWTVLTKKRKSLYGNVDMTTPKSKEEKALDKEISALFSQANQLTKEYHKMLKESKLA